MKRAVILAVALALAVAAAPALQAGSLGGAKVQLTTLPADHTDTWTVTFVGGVQAAVAIAGDGGTDLDLYVYDENDNFITKSDGPGDRESCSWTPRWTGKFKIKVVNRSRLFSNRYSIAWN
jgi:hypothetical protein